MNMWSEENLADALDICKILLKLYGDDENKCQEWLLTRNDLFFGNTPLQMIQSGQAQTVKNKLEEFGVNSEQITIHTGEGEGCAGEDEK